MGTPAEPDSGASSTGKASVTVEAVTLAKKNGATPPKSSVTVTVIWYGWLSSDSSA